MSLSTLSLEAKIAKWRQLWSPSSIFTPTAVFPWALMYCGCFLDSPGRPSHLTEPDLHLVNDFVESLELELIAAEVYRPTSASAEAVGSNPMEIRYAGQLKGQIQKKLRASRTPPSVN